jgi:parallel beta-helix repeat protein
VHDNVGNGVWCDAGCSGGFTVAGNKIVRNTYGGIRYENSDTWALIEDNIVKRNNTSDSRGRGGIVINSAQNAVVSSNTIRNNRHAGVVIGGRRRPIASVLVTNNVLEGNPVIRCSYSGVLCSGNL